MNEIAEKTQKRLYRISPYEDCDADFPIIAYSEEEALDLGNQSPIIKQFQEDPEDKIVIYEVDSKDLNIQDYPIGVFLSYDEKVDRQAFKDGIYDIIHTNCDWCQENFETKYESRINKEIVCETCWEEFCREKEEIIKKLYLELAEYEYKLDYLKRNFKPDFFPISEAEKVVEGFRTQLENAKQLERPEKQSKN